MPGVDIRSLGYVRLQSTMVDRWPDFGTRLLGLMAVDGPAPDGVHFRIDEHAARLVVVPGPVDRVDATGWELASRRALDDAVAFLADAGVACKWGSDEEAAERGVEAFASCADPGGNVLELYHSPVIVHDDLVLGGVSRFVTGEQGMGHVVLPGAPLAASFEFYTSVLGFGHRDSMLVSPPGVTPYRMRFLYCNARHHSVALTEAASTTGLRHLMLHTATIQDVGRAYDRCREADVLKTTIGQHSNDGMVSFYLYAPGGFEIEFATGGFEIDARTWTARELREFRLWGYEPVGN
ncbi:MAG: Biphenyl-2,3-diol 1,2-dioxygenase [Acidimicrobiales bacterium]|jgi:3,4-dihydroxy-9,10-secoandrosta-1,3,5(10)-triene-9,17-dione 4,5-dioxygenase|nr:Biphenyl-2,3-diol 1,2-dioxygenase [Acidimicrobiales bacterium]